MAEQEQQPSYSRTYFFLTFLLIDVLLTLILTSPLLIQSIQEKDSTTWWTTSYKLHSSLIDVSILSTFRILSAFFAIILSYYEKEPPSPPFELYHPNGEKKSTEEIDEEMVDECFLPWITRYLSRHCMLCEMLSFATFMLLVIKFLCRLNVEIGFNEDKVKHHPVWWSTLAVVGIMTCVELYYVESVMLCTGECARYHTLQRQQQRQQREQRRNSDRRISNNITDVLATPLLMQHEHEHQDVEQSIQSTNKETNEQELAGTSDISGDAQYKASIMDILKLCLPDAPLFIIAFIFLILAAIAQIYIPQFTGDILDALAENEDSYDAKDVWDVPGFMDSVIKLVICSILAGVFSGIRGSLFTLVSGTFADFNISFYFSGLVA